MTLILNNTYATVNESNPEEANGFMASLPLTAELTHIQAQALFLCDLQPIKMHLYNFIRKAMNYGADTDDLFQETLLKGFRYYYSFDRQQSFKTWIFTIAHNQINSFYSNNKAAIYGAQSLDEINEWTAATGDTAMSQQVQEIYRVAMSLKPRHREVFFLYYDNEFSVAEIANICGMTRPGVKFILHQARSTIKKIMEVQP